MPNYLSNTRNIDSRIYQWNGSSFVQFQDIPTIGALDWEFFTIGSDHYLAVTNRLNDFNNYNLDSIIYRWNGTSFVQFQSIPTTGANDWEFFTINGTPYLAVANYRNSSSYNIDSRIYQWNGSSFVQFQDIPTSGARDWEYFTLNNQHYLALAKPLRNQTGDVSRVQKLNFINKRRTLPVW
jgi:uncharacterized protein YukE